MGKTFPTSLLQFCMTKQAISVLQLGPWILSFFYKQSPLSIRSPQVSISGARNSQRGLITGFLAFIFINFGWFAKRNKPRASISTPSAYLSLSLKCQYVKWLPWYLPVCLLNGKHSRNSTTLSYMHFPLWQEQLQQHGLGASAKWVGRHTTGRGRHKTATLPIIQCNLQSILQFWCLRRSSSDGKCLKHHMLKKSLENWERSEETKSLDQKLPDQI